MGERLLPFWIPYDVQTPNNPRPSPPLSPSCLTIPSGTRVPRSTARAPASAASASTRPASSASTASTAADSASASAPTSSASRSRGKSCSVVVGAAVLIRARPLFALDHLVDLQGKTLDGRLRDG